MHGYPAMQLCTSRIGLYNLYRSRFDDRTTGNTDFYAPIAKEKNQIIHVDIEKKQFMKSIKSNFNILCDSKIFLKTLSQNIETNTRDTWVKRIKYLKSKHHFKYNNLEK